MTKKWDNVWRWGNPLLDPPQSYADNFIGEHWGVMRDVCRAEFWRTYHLWQRKLRRANANIDLLHKVAYYDREAKELGISNVQEYIGVRIDRTQPAVSQYLKMLDLEATRHMIGNYLYIEQKHASISSEPALTWKPTDEQVQTKLVSIPRDCAAGYPGCTGTTESGRLPLCKPCHVKVLATERTMPMWLDSEIKRIRSQHRKQAVDACYEDYYGTASMDELESYLDAG